MHELTDIVVPILRRSRISAIIQGGSVLSDKIGAVFLTEFCLKIVKRNKVLAKKVSTSEANINGQCMNQIFMLSTKAAML